MRASAIWLSCKCGVWSVELWGLGSASYNALALTAPCLPPGEGFGAAAPVQLREHISTLHSQHSPLPPGLTSPGSPLAFPS